MNRLIVATAAVAWWSSSAWADGCSQRDKPIDTDRPDITNSSLVVPNGSFQNENGVNYTRLPDARTLDGPNSRLRLGFAECLEVLIDLPNYLYTQGGGPRGFGNAAPAVKWQVSPVPGEIDLSAVAGVALPTGAKALRGNGGQPYLQFPWSVDLGEKWSLNGMVTNFFMPSENSNKYTNQTTLVIEREVGERAFLFGEYVGEFPSHGDRSHSLNSGGGYRITPLQQIDFHVAVGLNNAAPRFSFGIGYSFRVDGLF